MSNEAKLREELCALGRSLFERTLTHGSTGNLSVRCGDGWLSRLDADGTLLTGDPPTKEHFLHRAMYEERARNQAVIHLHSTHSVAVSVLEDVDPADVLPPLTAYYVMRIGTLPLVPYYAPGDVQLAAAVRGFAGRHHALLLANHGPVVAGSSLSAASDAIEELEATARLHLLLQGRRVRTLTPAQVAELHARFPQN